MVGPQKPIRIGRSTRGEIADGRIVPILGTVPIGIGMMGFFVFH